MRSTQFFELDPLERAPGPSFAGNQPRTAKTEIIICFLQQAQVPLSTLSAGSAPLLERCGIDPYAVDDDGASHASVVGGAVRQVPGSF